jgi:hypothetical protein
MPREAPPKISKDVARSMQTLALYAQTAEIPDPTIPVPSALDVKRVMDWIVIEAAGTFDEPFVAGREDVTSYLLGRRSVGLAIVTAMKVKPEILEGRKKDE